MSRHLRNNDFALTDAKSRLIGSRRSFARRLAETEGEGVQNLSEIAGSAIPYGSSHWDGEIPVTSAIRASGQPSFFSARAISRDRS